MRDLQGVSGYIEENAPTQEIGSMRWYWVPQMQEWYPSVTTILAMGFPKSEGLMSWFKRCTPEQIEAKSKEGREKGTATHLAIEKSLMQGGSPQFEVLDERERALLSGFKNWVADTPNLKFIEQEKAIFCNVQGVKFAGRFDCLAEVDGVRMVLDWKRSKSIYESYPPQVCAYAYALGLSAGGIVQLKDDTKKGYMFRAFAVAEHWAAFCHAFHMAAYLGLFRKQPKGL